MRHCGLALAALLVSAPAAAQTVTYTEAEQAWLRAHPVLRIAPDPDFRPIEYFDEQGRYSGAAADLIRLLERHAGLHFTVVRAPNWDGVMERFRAHEVDLLGALVRTPAREQFALFTDPLVTVPGGIFTRTGTPTPLTLADLRGKKIAVVSNYTAHDVLRSRHPELLLEVVPDVSTGLAKASLGMVDAYVENMANASYYSQAAGLTNLQLAGTTPFEYRWSVGIRKDWPELQAILNKGLAAIPEGERRKVMNRWISIRAAPWRPSLAAVLGAAAALLAALLAVSALWNARLRRSRGETAANERLFRALFQNLGDPVYIIDPAGVILAANDRASLTLGHTPKEMAGMPLAELDADGDAAAVARGLQEVVARRRVTFETIHRRKDGTCFPVEVNTTAIEFHGRPAILSIARDLSERRKTERRQAAASRITQAFVLNTTDGALFAQLQAVVREALDSPLAVVGYLDAEGALVCPAPATTLGSLDMAGTPSVFPASTWGEAVWGQALRSGEARRSDHPRRELAAPLGAGLGVVFAAGREQDYSEADVGLLQALCEHLAPLLSARLEQQRSARAFHHQAERLALYFDRMPLGCIVWGTDQRVQGWNPAAERLFGWTGAEALGRPLAELVLAPEARAEAQQRWEQVLRGEGATRVEQNTSKAGDARTCQWTNTPFRDVEGGNAGAISMILDITEQQRAEREHRRLEQQMMHAQKLESLGVLAGGIAHDFNNLLTSIVGNADLALLDLEPGSRARESLETIVTGAARAADLVKQMLAYSGKGAFVIERVDPAALVEELTQMLRVSISKNAALRFELAPDLPPVEGDATQLRQVVMNLVINASEALPDRGGTITVRARAVRVDGPDPLEDPPLLPGPYVAIEVGDDGCGMDEATRARIFDPFFTTKFTGRGLGLAAVLGIVRGHRGAIRVESRPGEGTTFRVLLPTSEGAGVQPAPVAGPVPLGWKASGRVLLVDDEATVRAVGARMLQQLGLGVLLAQDGREAIAAYRNASFDLVLLDLTMPHLDGVQTLLELRRIDPQAKVIISSGFSEQEVTGRFAGERLAGFIQKPYTLAALREVLHRALGEPRAD